MSAETLARPAEEARSNYTETDAVRADAVFQHETTQAISSVDAGRYLMRADTSHFSDESILPTREMTTSAIGLDPLANPPANNESSGGRRHANTPPANPANGNASPSAAYAGIGQGPGGASTPFAGGGGGGSSGGGSSPVGGNLATLANEGAFNSAHVGGAAAASSAPGVGGQQTTSQAVLSPSAGNSPSMGYGYGSANVASSGFGFGYGSGMASGSGYGSGVGSGSASSSGSPSQLTGYSSNFGATEGGLTSFNYGSTLVGDNLPVQGTAGTALSNVMVVTFGDNNPLSQPSDFSATIDWGDNTTTTGAVAALAGGGFGVSGSHTYPVAGIYNVSATIMEAGSPLTVTTGTTEAVIKDTPIVATAVSVSATEGTAANNVTVATFTNANPSAPLSSYSATIDWGDGSETTNGTITGGNGDFTVTGSHTYTEGGSYQAVVTILSQGGSSAAVAATATVTDLPLTGTQLTVTPAATGSSTTLTDTFTDANISESPNNYLAQINWGDGWTDDAAVSGSNGSYSLPGSHVYDHPGNYTITVTVTDAGGSTLTQTANAVITAAGLSAAGTALTATAGQPIAGAQIAAFTDGNTDQMNDWFGPASGYTTTIDWGDGSGLDSSATVDGDASGFYVMGSHTYANPGAYTATVTIANSDGASTTTTSTVDVTTITPTGAAFNASEGVAANNVTVATFADAQPDSYTATIDWGDGGTPTSGTVSGSNGNYTVTGSYTYADGGAYPVTVTIANSEGLTAIATGTANVADAPLTATPQTLTIPENSPLTNAALATFTDANGNDSLSSYSASIDWGDGSPTDEGTIGSVNGVLTVTGSHTYTSEGSFAVTVSIGDDGGATTTANSTISVISPLINATPVSLAAQEDVPLNDTTVATFTAPGQPSDYTATIDWGDGTTETGTVTGSNGNYSVVGTHTYTQPTDGQQYGVTVTIADAAGDTATTLSSATVDGGTVAATASNPTDVEASSQMIALASFTDSDPSYSADEFTALVDWGDGTPQDFATVTGSNGMYSVMDTHAYAEEGDYTVTIQLTDPNGVASAPLTEPMVVADAALSGSNGIWLNATQGVVLQNVEVATFTDQDASAPATNYTASINWGDGSTTAGVVSGAYGGFSVSGSHTYGNYGSFSIQVTISDAGGSQARASSYMSVSEAPNYYVGSFSDTNLNDTVGSFQASINWGDGTVTSSEVIGGGSGAFYIMGAHAYAEDGSYSVTVTVSGPGGPITIDSTASVAEAPLMGSQSPPAAPPAAPPVAVVPEVSFNFSQGGLGGLLKNVIATKTPGLRIHIDDNFFNLMVDPGNPGSIIADNRQLSIALPTFNTNLVHGTITIGPANTVGRLIWTIPNSVRVWWQPRPNLPWQLLQSGGIPRQSVFQATGQPIPIVLQGITPDGGQDTDVSVEYTIDVNDVPTSANASFFYNVYTGLNVGGGQGPQQKLIGQIAQASGYTLTTDLKGDVWRTSMSELNENQGYIYSFRDYLDPILQNTNYGMYQNEKTATKIVAISTPNNTPGYPDSYDFKSFYPDNIGAMASTNTPDAIKFAAALLIHPLQEQYQHQILGLPFETTKGAKNLSG